ncbi:MAG TPA: serine hydrolase domain-containing protein [Vicinamibacterales bacterium]|nr:serine hydrolase domain-containing protein [Vicinamibacterales bacterium]
MAPLARSWVLRCLLIVAAIETVRAQEVDDFVRDWMQKQHVPAVALAVIKDGTLIKAEGFGLSDVENHISARPDTVFKIGSLSKQFLAAGIMLLVQDGRVTVDDKVGKFLAGAPAPWAPITLRHLLTHTSGLVRESPGFDFNKRQSDLDVVRAAYSVPLASVPGEKYEYSNLGYFALAEVITQVSGKPWADFLNERIFVPLGMTATRVTSLADIIPNRAHGYAWSSGQLQNEDDWPAIRPSGAFVSTILDLAKWDRSLSGEQILKDASKREMWQSVRLNNGRTFPYGFGWQLDDWPADAPTPTGVPMMRHGGAINGFRAGYARWPRQRLTVIVLTNLTNAPYEGLVANVAIRYVPELKTQPAR